MIVSAASPDYTIWLNEVKSRIQTARIAAAQSINRELTLLYWNIGREIVEKQERLGWGKSVVDRLSANLQAEFPSIQGFSASNLWRMRQFYRLHMQPEFLAQAARELGKKFSRGSPEEVLAQPARELLGNVPWWHHVEVMVC